jgi:hypothetical protein
VQLPAQRRNQPGERGIVPAPSASQVSLLGAVRAPLRAYLGGGGREPSGRNFAHERQFCPTAAVSPVNGHDQPHVNPPRRLLMSPTDHPHRPADGNRVGLVSR